MVKLLISLLRDLNSEIRYNTNEDWYLKKNDDAEILLEAINTIITWQKSLRNKIILFPADNYDENEVEEVEYSSFDMQSPVPKIVTFQADFRLRMFLLFLRIIFLASSI